MSARYKHSRAKTLKATGECISSAELPAGPTPLSLPAGQQRDLFSPGQCNASRSAQRGSAKAKRTKDTSGRCSFGSSESASLGRALVNRLLQTMDTDGSLEYEMTWKKRAMQSGAPIFRLAARVRRIGGNGCSGWPSPNAQEFGAANVEVLEVRRKKYQEKYGNNGFGLTLGHAANAWLAGWPTYKSTDGDKGARTHRGAELELEQKGSGADLPTIAASVAGWATPTVIDATGSQYAYSQGDHSKKVLKLPGQAILSGPTASLSPAETVSGDVCLPERMVLNYRFSLWLQGYPAEWASCAERATR